MITRNKIRSINFKRASNIFINAGIVGLNHYLEEGERKGVFSNSFEKDLSPDQLTIKSDDIATLLSEVYYFMGKELYDTSGKNARTSPNKSYFIKSPFSAVPFYKMKTYGVSGLITNDPVPVAKEEENSITFKKLTKSDPDFATVIARHYAKKGDLLKGYDVDENGFKENTNSKKGDSKLFLNAPYIKITRLEPLISIFLEQGKNHCYLTNENVKKLVDVQNTSPFIKGLNNFSSHLSPTSQKVSWKAMYLSRFSPKLGLYSYVSRLDSIICFFFDSNNLTNLNKLFQQNSAFYKDSLQMIDSNYMSNLKVFNFWSEKKEEERFTEPRDYTGKNELQFVLIYSIYQNLLYDQGQKSSNEISSLFDLGIDKTPISLINFRADKFSGTLRPNAFDYFNNFKFIISLIVHFEKEGIEFQQILESLKFLKTSEQNSANKHLLKRKLRNNVFGKILNGKSILKDIELLFYQCFTYLLKGDRIGHKNFKQLTLFTQLYESIINNNMTKEIQEKAFNLGTSIGMAILNYEGGSDKKSNAKSGRKYLIDLQKSRTMEQFNKAIIRLQNKYQITVSTELFKEMLDDDNFMLVKQFAVIGALNRINITIKPQKKNNDEK